METILKAPETQKEWKAYYRLRWEVLRKPWGKPQGSEQDNFEKEAVHVMALKRGGCIPIGVGRLHFLNRDEAQIRYMAVKKGEEGIGTGKRMLLYLEQKAVEENARRIVLNAREHAVGFYLKNGYIKVGTADELFGSIPHFRMTKEL